VYFDFVPSLITDANRTDNELAAYSIELPAREDVVTTP
jgi:hypothetical protein